ELMDKCKEGDGNYGGVVSDLLDGRGEYIVEVIRGSYQDLDVRFFGGGHGERKGGMMGGLYFKGEREEFELSLFEVEYGKKFVRIEDEHVVGRVM
ncbi:YlmH/Sll1252 family protein, partial [Staphylococcus epidermidis]|uniref:YlmH/Sll1252 family protein n=1 Tax=Staphylococcus epidermidis TaxID=1282 RepID=UPI0021B2BED5